MIIFLYFSEDFGAVFLHVATRRFIGGLSHELSKTVLKPRVSSFKASFRTAIVQVRLHEEVKGVQNGKNVQVVDKCKDMLNWNRRFPQSPLQLCAVPVCRGKAVRQRHPSGVVSVNFLPW